MSEPIQFPRDFLWGAATSAYQVEGSPLADGAGPSNWHRFAHTPGMTANGDTGDLACDHYRRYQDDVRLMQQLGLNAYRFSISWSRVLPDGKGTVNAAGLSFYDRLVDALLQHGIKPNATLFHWDLPAGLEDRGGWLNRDSSDWFGDYASIVVRKLGDRVAMWATLNEPWVVTDGGYLHGTLAPGHRSQFETPIASHNLLRAHGAGIQAIRAAGGKQAGLVVNLEPKYPASQSPADPPPANGSVDDPLRVQYYRDHLLAAHRAMQQGVDLRGYFAWSLLDNLEWSAGFTRRFGLVHVDFDTQVRTPKASARFYTEVIRSAGAALE
jgi:beta-glucosidase